MKRLHATLTILALLFSVIPLRPAQAAGWTESEEPTTRTLYGIDASGDTVIAVGNAGTVVYSLDGGDSWETGDSDVSATLYDVAVMNEDDAVAVGSNATVIYTDDGGETWQEADVDLDSPESGYDLYAVSMGSSTSGFAVGENGVSVHTANGGEDWSATDEVADDTDSLYAVHASSASTAWAVGEGGSISKTTDGGDSWTAQTSHVTSDLRSVSFSGSSSGLASGDDGVVLQTTNGGSTWSELDVDDVGSEAVLRVSLFGTEDGTLATADGLFLSTDDLGDTWEEIDADGSPTFNDLVTVSSSEWWAVGEGGTVYRYDASAPDRPSDFDVEGDADDVDTATPTFTWDAPDDDVDHYELEIIGESTRNAGDDTEYTWPSSLDDGDYDAELYAVDGAGNESSAAELSFTINADNTSESDEVSSVTPTTAMKGENATFSVRLDDSGDIESCELYVDGESEKTMTVKTDVAYAAYTFSENGTYELYARCEDADGDRVSGERTSVTVSAGSAYADAGDIIKTACSGDVYVNDPCTSVYYYGKDGKRHAFPNEDVFNDWFGDFDDLVVLSSSAMSTIPLGRNVTHRPGGDMLKFSTSAVYAVSYLGVLRPIVDADIADALYGDDWQSNITVVNDVFYGNYRFGSAIESSADFSSSNARSVTSSIDAMF